MKPVLKPVRSPFSAGSIERLLSHYFAQFAEWGQILTRGDATAAEEIVQDLCLHLTVAQPDLTAVNDLDAYLYTCLRNMYTSRLARVSRERLRVIQIEDYDQVGMAIDRSELDSVDVQNELIRIGDYLVSRKFTSKSASHFILHFFLGYRRSDVALLARLPIAAIYNKLKDIRCELRKHLSSSEGIRVTPRGVVPGRAPLRSALSSESFLMGLRALILDGDSADCAPENDLIDAYKRPGASPVGCHELAHLAGCERCLNLLERAFRLDNREGPLEGLDGRNAPKGEGGRSFDATMRIVRRRREQLFERRPSLLAIAVDGRVVAFHAIESARNSLSSRVEAASTVRFIEVFDEYGDRLAHIPLDTESITPDRHRLSQEILLSDYRQLRLEVRFDGLGIHAEVDYTDPSLLPFGELEEKQHAIKARVPVWARFWRPGKVRMVPWGAVAFASVMLASAFGVAAFRYMHPAWRDVLARSEAMAEIPSPSEALHQTLRVEEDTEASHGAYLGTVDVWRSGDHKEVRLLHDAHQRLLATSTKLADGTTSNQFENAAVGEMERQIVESGVWRSDLSGAAFETGREAVVQAFRGSGAIEVTQQEDGRGRILSRTLVFDLNYRIQEERVRFRTAGGVSEVRLVQTLLRRVPKSEFPDTTFPPPHGLALPGRQGDGAALGEPGANQTGNAGLADLEVSVLFELFKQKADVGQPIEVTPAAGGRIRLSGTLADGQLRTEIQQGMLALPDAGRVDFQIRSVGEAASAVHRENAHSQELVGTSGDAPAAELVRATMIARGLKGEALKNAEQEFEASALAHAQAALQHAYALDRLGMVLKQASPSSLDSDSRVKWAQMVDQHSTAVIREFHALSLQLDSVSTDINEIPFVDAHGITDAAAFVRATSDLRSRAQSVNEQVVELFAGSAANVSPTDARDSIARLRGALPVVEARRLSLFADLLEARIPSAQRDVGNLQQR